MTASASVPTSTIPTPSSVPNPEPRLPPNSQPPRVITTVSNPSQPNKPSDEVCEVVNLD
jgi:hypothetical protein